MNILRQKVHDAYAQMLDLTLYGEKVLEWNAEDTLIYSFCIEDQGDEDYNDFYIKVSAWSRKG